MRNVAMIVSYTGTSYAGFQYQPKLQTVQGCIEDAIMKLTGVHTRIHGSGRTDAGVHARGQVIHFYTESAIPENKWAIAMNTLLPKDIVIVKAVDAPSTFHSRKSNHQKTYRYTIYNHHVPDVFRMPYEYRHYTKLNVDQMREGLQYLVGTHDFTSFCSPLSTKSSHIRTIYKAWIEEERENFVDTDSNRIHIYITGDGFLYQMVRIIAGTLIQIGEGRIEASMIESILLKKRRSAAGITAQPYGLTLWEVDYDQKIFS